MKYINKMTTTFPGKSTNESFARSVIASFASQADPTLTEMADVKTAVSEAVTNCIVHAYKEGIGNITMSAALFENGKLTIVIADKGCGIDDVKQAMEPMFTTGGEERAGLGFAVMESFMDKVKVRSIKGKGTKVTLIKTLGEK